MSTVNIVKYYFHKRNVPVSEELFVRSEVHFTTTINGRRQKDPLGAHVTFSYKTQDSLGRDTHVSCHGYVKDSETLEYAGSTHVDEKPDSTKKTTGKPVWPGESQLWEAPEIGIGALTTTTNMLPGPNHCDGGPRTSRHPAHHFTENVMPVTRKIAPRDENDEATAILPVQPLNLYRDILTAIATMGQSYKIYSRWQRKHKADLDDCMRLCPG
ncbi:hypothetical protein FVER53590_13857 [Fusarium verticillioides]|nr:hypothetical protein FVER53590_13857 [Fusarium verticillioides]